MRTHPDVYESGRACGLQWRTTHAPPHFTQAEAEALLFNMGEWFHPSDAEPWGMAGTVYEAVTHREYDHNECRDWCQQHLGTLDLSYDVIQGFVQGVAEAGR